MDVYEKDNKVAVLVAGSFGAPWSAGVDKRLAYDKRVVEFWLKHKDDKLFMQEIDAYKDNSTIQYAKKTFSDWGYKDLYFGGFADIELVWVDKGVRFQIREYDGSEWIEYFDENDWTVFS